MSCTVVLSAYGRGCNSVSGIEKIYMIDKAARELAGITLSVTTGAATIAGTGGTAYEWNPMQNGFSFTQPITQDNSAGTSSIVQTLDGVLHGYSAAVVYLIGELRKGRFEAAIKMRNGTYIYAGLDQTGLQIGGGDSGATGAAINDPSGTTINLTCECQDEAPTIIFSEFETAFTINAA